MKRFLVAMGIFSFLLSGCKKKSAAPTSTGAVVSQHPPALDGSIEVTVRSEGGFHDLVFYIEQCTTLASNQKSIRVTGMHDGKRLRLEIMLGAQWQAGSIGQNVKLTTYTGKVSYKSVGADSDSFLGVLDELYGTKLSPKFMRPSADFTGISLEGDPRNLEAGSVKIKLFYESGAEADYAELYTNIDLAAKSLEIREKDEGYRAPIINALRTP